MRRTCAFVSFRLGRADGVSAVTSLWQRCFENLGWATITVAGDGPVDRSVPGLEIGARHPPDRQALEAALADADLVVAENILTIPMNLAASRALAAVLRGRPTIVHHHDPPWQRARFAHVVELPADDPAWHHVTINQLTATQFALRGLTTTTIHNGFDTEAAAGNRIETRRRLGIEADQPLVVHPVRAIARKNVPAAVEITCAVGGVYWLPGPAEEDYADTLSSILARAACPVLRTPLDDLGRGVTMADLYAASDLVVFPSTWEGFGNPPFEAAIHRRPVVVGRYPVADELRALGFWWLDPDDGAGISEAIDQPPTHRLEHNRRLVEAELSIPKTTERVNRLLIEAGFCP
jgi:glycosyltransferase involved in cell wall biosynthesis